MKKLFLITTLFLSASLFSQTKKALFLGNSYTSYNDLPSLVKNVALSFGDTLDTQKNTPGGYYFAAHTTNPTTLSLINASQWDFVVLQEQSQIPSLPPSITGSDYSVPHSITLNNLIKQNNPCTETVFYMTWGRKIGDASYCAQHPPVCTYEGMQEELRRTYMLMADTNEAMAAPVGMAWKHVRDNNPSIELYTGDGSHPSLHGSYLAACVFYATMYQKSPVGSTYIPGGISDPDAAILQNAAAITVLDDLTSWNIGVHDPMADFSHTGNETIDFTNISSNGGSFEWHFDDGNSSFDESPSHTYLTNGIYNVQLIVYDDDNCKSDTIVKPVGVFPSGQEEQSVLTSISVSPNPVQERLNVKFSSSNLNLKIYNISGKVVKEYSSLSPSMINLSDLGSGLYFLEFQDQNHQRKSFKLVKE